MEDAIYWIWLQEVLGIGSVLVDNVIEKIGTARKIFEMDRQELLSLRIFSTSVVDKITSTTLDNAQKSLERAGKLGCTVVTPEHCDYPPAFMNMHCKPCVLYVLGTLSISAPLSLTVVGTRRSSNDGVRAARDISRELASVGCQIVSGLAVGIDQNAHEGALLAHGRTVGVLACGMKVPYPVENGVLKRKIIDEGGALFSEFPFDMPPYGKNFHIRNRLMAGLSQGTLVIQASRRSGALITAKHAFDNDRDVFAIPGNIYDDSMSGCNHLIQTYATLVTGAHDILETYFERFSQEDLLKIGKYLEKSEPRPPVVVTVQRKTIPEVSRIEQPIIHEIHKQLTQEELETMGITQFGCKVYAALRDELENYDILLERTGLVSSQFVSALTELEIFSLIDVSPGRRYKKHHS